MTKIKMILFSFLLAASASFASATVFFSISAQDCLNNIKFSPDGLIATCKVRKAEALTDVEVSGTTAMNFALPPLDGSAKIEGFVRPLSRGYILKLKSEGPISMDHLKKYLPWIIEALGKHNGGNYIVQPSSLCDKILAEIDALKL